MAPRHATAAPHGGGGVHWRGWCHWPGQSLREIRLHFAPNFSWPATLGLPRPDVAAQLSVPEARASGFEVRVKLPQAATRSLLRR
ncbi:hypothetical protein [Oleiharenicola sp. Vm1]|uniref:hypothetical protein n=1 Tax=Oleiharenicola sp. Vm1 TaxID=3398393 RepID=UPI0039F4A446